MEDSEISNECVEGYESIFTALEDELQEVEHFFAENTFSNWVGGVVSSDTFNLHKCVNLSSGDATASNFLEEERAEYGLLAGTLAQSTDGLAGTVDSFPDICEDYLLDVINDDTNIPHMEKIDANNEKETDSTTTVELNPLARIFRFRTKPRARNAKRGKPATYDYLKSFIRYERDMRLTKPKKRYENESLEYNLRTRMTNYRSFGAICGNFEDDVSENINGRMKTRKGMFGRRKRHISWSIPEVLKLVEGVSKHGVGKWTEIKKLFFSTCAHRSSVDLKDKWRNLLRASCKSSKGTGEWVRGNGSPTVPHHILCRVRELSIIHPYPRQQQRKIKVDKKTSSSTFPVRVDNTLPLSSTTITTAAVIGL